MRFGGSGFRIQGLGRGRAFGLEVLKGFGIGELRFSV